jgi:hypothetical protein
MSAPHPALRDQPGRSAFADRIVDVNARECLALETIYSQ